MTTLVLATGRGRVGEFIALTKPRVVALMVFTALIGMVLAPPGPPDAALVLTACLGIGLAAAGAAAVNCLVERHIDARMARTRARPLPRGQVTPAEALTFALLLAGGGLALLAVWVNTLAMLLTAGTFFAYSVVYTLWLKPATPLNIVIGGASGAMPPVLGWAAMTGEVGHEALLLSLLIFVWTPPHFWALALYRKADYVRSGLPMLPVTHGDGYTCLHILLYTLLLSAVSLLPVAVGMAQGLYLLCVVVLDAYYLALAWRLWRRPAPGLARFAFTWSIVYLGALFSALLLDHYLRFPL